MSDSRKILASLELTSEKINGVQWALEICEGAEGGLVVNEYANGEFVRSIPTGSVLGDALDFMCARGKVLLSYQTNGGIAMKRRAIYDSWSGMSDSTPSQS